MKNEKKFQKKGRNRNQKRKMVQEEKRKSQSIYIDTNRREGCTHKDMRKKKKNVQEDMTKESFAITEADLGIRSEDTHQFIKAGSGLKKITKEEIFTDEK